MKKANGKILYSAADILNFLDCEHHTSLDLTDLETPLPRSSATEEQKLIQNKGLAFEARYAQKLKDSGLNFVNIDEQGKDIHTKAQATLNAMRQGADIIFQGHLIKDNLFGVADFMRKVPVPSALGEHSYEVIDTKLSLSTKVRFVIQLAFYSRLLSFIQEIEPQNMYIVLGDQTQKTYPYKDYSRYLKNLLDRFFQSVNLWHQPPDSTYPDPRDHCSFCRWLDICDERRLQDDHLCQVAGITKAQMKKMKSSGITTLEQLGRLDPSAGVPGILPQSLEKIAKQASLQLKARETGKNSWELLPYQDGEKRGFARMPKPSPGDMFFDMEGNPMEEGGLEYLFGVYLFENGNPEFKAFWAHTRSEEKKAFEDFMDFVLQRLKDYPDAHIYHYAHYEATALKKLMSMHGTRESAVDNLLRAGKLVDLYKVVREGIRVSEPGYSIKNLESFYMDKRSGDVQTAAGSIVFYEQWKETGDDGLLKKIEDYNYDDVLSTYLLREWLLELRPDNIPWHGEIEDGSTHDTDIGALNEHEERIEDYRKRMIDPLPEDKSQWTGQDYAKELTWQLLDFYRRSEKPLWWAYYSRLEMDEDELIEDVECIAGVTPDPARVPEQVKRSLRHFFTFPEQETKIKSRDSVACLDDGLALSNLEVDDQNRQLSFTLGKNKNFGHVRFNVGPKGPVPSDPLKEAVFRFADSLIADDEKYRAIKSLLNRQQPNIQGHTPGSAIIDQNQDILPQMSQAISSLDHSHIFIQGPPGSGKTYSGSRTIADLLQKGFRVGVSSNSHKAIINLLESVENVAKERGFSFKGAKKSNKDLESTHIKGEFIEDHFDNKKIFNEEYQLLAGTAWLFSSPALDQKLDYLFIDEAGQVALANMVAMGTSARNIVLLGDQMQLGQPIQGVHPGRSGESTLEYLLDGKATIPPDKGIFLGTTWRMNPEVNALISDMIYESRLEPESNNANQRLILNGNAHSALLPAGVRHIPVKHDGCSQKSQEEAEVVKELVESLTSQQYQDKHKNIHPLGLENILVVAPYNLQVNLLKSVLPQGARVGTVDKFQGQQAEVVIVSMATSNEEYLPRHIDFLFSKNRLNVAVSRAKSLAIVVSNPALMSIKCSQPEQVALVNALCWVKE
ncbi:TM0106 family RecB-like putative nuclease [Desulfonatronovibrio magnus]|uniref:TM0106 family RecB-like putative nuclease n=1 Tax=Desulfonatronovibrio magnus TaxID=698827 RepID=UPI0005EBC45F|nr:TM0106 family RecB-like putative nuclease [Desulfonatronovibrio magnus]